MVAASRPGSTTCSTRFDMPADFTIPGENRLAAALDLARTVVRRAERLAVPEPTRGPSWRLPEPALRPAVGHGALAGGARAHSCAPGVRPYPFVAVRPGHQPARGGSARPGRTGPVQ